MAPCASAGRQHQRVLGISGGRGTDDGIDSRNGGEAPARGSRLEIEDEGRSGRLEGARLADGRRSSRGWRGLLRGRRNARRMPPADGSGLPHLPAQPPPALLRRSPLREIKTKHVEEFQRHQLNEKKLAGSTVAQSPQSAPRDLQAGDAARVRGWQPGRVRPTDQRQATDQDIRFLEVEEVEALIRAVHGRRSRQDGRRDLLDRCDDWTAPRRVVALRWKDVDWEAGKIRVRRSFTRGASMRSEVAEVSERPCRWRIALPPNSSATSSAPPTRTRTTASSAIPTPATSSIASTLRTRFKERSIEQAFDRVRFHDLRHTFATQMAAAGSLCAPCRPTWATRTFRRR